MGNLSSGKSALVHRYLTGTYVQEESPEGKSMLPAPILFEPPVPCVTPVGQAEEHFIFWVH